MGPRGAEGVTTAEEEGVDGREDGPAQGNGGGDEGDDIGKRRGGRCYDQGRVETDEGRDGGRSVIYLMESAANREAGTSTGGGPLTMMGRTGSDR